MPSVPSAYRRHAAPALRRVAAVPEIEAECLVVVVLPVQVREPDVAHPREIGAERLICEAGPDLGVFVRHVAAAEPEVEPRAVDVLVRVLREDHRLAVQSADRSRIDVPADAVVKANPDIEAPAVVSLAGGGGACVLDTGTRVIRNSSSAPSLAVAGSTTATSDGSNPASVTLTRRFRRTGRDCEAPVSRGDGRHTREIQRDDGSR